MHRPVLPHSILSLIAGSVAAAGAVAAVVVGCSEDEPAAATSVRPGSSEPATPLADVPEARSRIETLRALFPADMARAEGRFERLASGAVRLVAPPRAQMSGTVELPARADTPFRLTDRASGVAVAVSLVGAEAVSITTDRAVALYRGAAAGGADLLHRVDSHGTEDFVVFERSPAEPVVRYEVDISAAAGLRLVANTLEFVDAQGVPRLRVAPPHVADAQGTRRTATLAVEGCAVGTSPRMPWLHPITPPGAAQCTVTVRWSAQGLRYPVLVDPQWQTTAPMIYARIRPAVAEIKPPAASTHLLLVTGGFDSAGNAHASAEIYLPLERVFAAAPDMSGARGDHTATNLADDGTGKVLVVGGAMRTAPTPTATELHRSADVYDPVDGKFSALVGMMEDYRYRHAATLLGDGKVLITGGIATPNTMTTPQSSIEAELFDPVGQTFLDAADTMSTARAGHAALRLPGGDVLITGGFGSSNAASNSAELYCAPGAINQDPICAAMPPGQFAGNDPTDPIKLNKMGALRALHTMTLLENGDVLVAGGVNASQGPVVNYSANADRYTPGQGFVQVIPMATARAHHTATRLPTGDVLLAGGFDGNDSLNPVTLDTTKLYDSGLTSFANHLVLPGPRKDHAAALVVAGGSAAAGKGVLVLGGSDAMGMALNDAHVLVRDLGDACTLDAECLSGHCADFDANQIGVCCDDACNGICRACRDTTKEQPDGGPISPAGTCGFAKLDTDLGWSCVFAPGQDVPVELHQICDGMGNPIAKEGSSCVANGCDGDAGRCSTTCPCNDAGFCTDMAEDGGMTMQHCELRKDKGEKCLAGPQCKSGNCIDGYCCDTPCNGQCEACNVTGFEGTCKPAGLLGNSAPVGSRPACAGTDGSACKGACDSDDTTSCTYAGPATVDQSECACSGGACSQTNHACDQQGGSNPVVVPCAGFGCKGNVCNTTCASDAECAEDAYCDNSTCKDLPPEGRCDGDHTIRIPKQSDRTCLKYKCEPGGSACLTSCTSVDQCVEGHVCSRVDGKTPGQCILPPSQPPLSSCSTTPARSSPAGWAGWAAVLAALAAAIRRPKNQWYLGGAKP